MAFAKGMGIAREVRVLDISLRCGIPWHFRLQDGQLSDEGWALKSMLTKGLIVYAGDVNGRREGVGARCTGEDRNGEVGREQGIEENGTEVASGLEMKKISIHHSRPKEMIRSILTPAKATLVIVLMLDAVAISLELNKEKAPSDYDVAEVMGEGVRLSLSC